MSDEQHIRAYEYAATITALREFADWLEAHPEVVVTTKECVFLDYRIGRNDFLARLREIGGPWKIDEDNGVGYLGVSKRFGFIRYRIYTERENIGEERPVQRIESEFVIDRQILDEIAAPEGVTVDGR